MSYSLLITAFFTFCYMSSFVATDDTCLPKWAVWALNDAFTPNDLLEQLQKICKPVTTNKPLVSDQKQPNEREYYKKFMNELVESLARKCNVDLKSDPTHYDWTHQIRVPSTDPSMERPLYGAPVQIIGHILIAYPEAKNHLKDIYSLAVVRGEFENTYFLATSNTSNGGLGSVPLTTIAEVLYDKVNNSFIFKT